jgi:hypothetical protein
MGRGNVAVQTVGPDVTTTSFRIDDQDYYVIDRGDPVKVTNLEAQGIKLWEGDEKAAMRPK